MSEKEIIKALRLIFGMEDTEPDEGILFIFVGLMKRAAVCGFLTVAKKINLEIEE